jgi:hypothetical protein
VCRYSYTQSNARRNPVALTTYNSRAAMPVLHTIREGKCEEEAPRGTQSVICGRFVAEQ